METLEAKRFKHSWAEYPKSQIGGISNVQSEQELHANIVALTTTNTPVRPTTTEGAVR